MKHAKHEPMWGELTHDELAEMRIRLLRDESVDSGDVLRAVEELLRAREPAGNERTWSIWKGLVGA